MFFSRPFCNSRYTADERMLAADGVRWCMNTALGLLGLAFVLVISATGTTDVRSPWHVVDRWMDGWVGRWVVMLMLVLQLHSTYIYIYMYTATHTHKQHKRSRQTDRRGPPSRRVESTKDPNPNPSRIRIHLSRS